MRKRVKLLIALSVLVIAIVSFFAFSHNPQPKIHSRALIHAQVKGTGFFPFAFQNGPRAIRRILDSSESRSVVARTSALDETGFQLEEVGGVRETMLLYINYCYSGTDSNRALSVASNAANRVIAYYSTNQPSWEVTFEVSECFTPKSSWQRIKDSADDRWWRFKSWLDW